MSSCPARFPSSLKGDAGSSRLKSTLEGGSDGFLTFRIRPKCTSLKFVERVLNVALILNCRHTSGL